MIVDFFNNKPCPESATSFNASAPIWYPHPLSLGDQGHQRLGMVENSFIVKMRVLIFLWFVAHISKILLMVYLFPPKVIRTETNMDIGAKSKIKILFVESHMATYWGVERQKWARLRVYSAEACEDTREY